MTDTPPGSPYRSPPVIECVIELRLTRSITDDKLARLTKKFEKNTVKTTLFNPAVNINFQLKQNRRAIGKAEAVPLVIGEKYERWENLATIQIFPNSIIYAELAPYKGWDIFSANLFQELSTIQRICPSLPIGRVGMRYINRIDIPTPTGNTINVSDYLKMGVAAPVREPIKAFESILRVDLEQNYEIMLRTVSSEPVVPSHSSVILDIDASYNAEFNIKDGHLPEILSKLRGYKNDFFERVVADQAREIFARTSAYV